MKLNMYTFRDDAAQSYGQPFFQHNDGLATRLFADLVNDKSPNAGYMSTHPHQFSLVKLGEYDDKTGIVTMLSEGPL